VPITLEAGIELEVGSQRHLLPELTDKDELARCRLAHSRVSSWHCEPVSPLGGIQPVGRQLLAGKKLLAAALTAASPEAPGAPSSRHGLSQQSGSEPLGQGEEAAGACGRAGH